MLDNTSSENLALLDRQTFSGNPLLFQETFGHNQARTLLNAGLSTERPEINPETVNFLNTRLEIGRLLVTQTIIDLLKEKDRYPDRGDKEARMRQPANPVVFIRQVLRGENDFESLQAVRAVKTKQLLTLQPERYLPNTLSTTELLQTILYEPAPSPLYSRKQATPLTIVDYLTFYHVSINNIINRSDDFSLDEYIKSLYRITRERVDQLIDLQVRDHRVHNRLIGLIEEEELYQQIIAEQQPDLTSTALQERLTTLNDKIPSLNLDITNLETAKEQLNYHINLALATSSIAFLNKWDNSAIISAQATNSVLRIFPPNFLSTWLLKQAETLTTNNQPLTKNKFLTIMLTSIRDLAKSDIPLLTKQTVLSNFLETSILLMNDVSVSNNDQRCNADFTAFGQELAYHELLKANPDNGQPSKLEIAIIITDLLLTHKSLDYLTHLPASFLSLLTDEIYANTSDDSTTPARS